MGSYSKIRLADIEADIDAERLTAIRMLSMEDFEFHNSRENSAHNLHAFPAKFPPELPRTIIRELTSVGDVVLDPMCGSGTTVLEAAQLDRIAVGVDIDPLSVLVAQIKITPVDLVAAYEELCHIVESAASRVHDDPESVKRSIASHFDEKSAQFVNYWFHPQTQLELMALIESIESCPDRLLRRFFRVVLSSIIITKTGGVSLALDLAHTRPHKAQIMSNPALKPDSAVSYRRKILRSPIQEFKRRGEINIQSISNQVVADSRCCVLRGNALGLPLADESADLIITSPPYASNAIDYMRAHKFSLVWFKYPIETLSDIRSRYIGGDSVNGFSFEPLPMEVQGIVSVLSCIDAARGKAVERYFIEIQHSLREMFRVLRRGKAAVVVIGNSVFRGVSIETASSVARIGEDAGFVTAGINSRKLDRNRRMMPIGKVHDAGSQIQNRMLSEEAVFFYKPYQEAV